MTRFLASRFMIVSGKLSCCVDFDDEDEVYDLLYAIVVVNCSCNGVG